MKSSVALEWFSADSAEFTGQLFFGEFLAKYTYYRIGGPARVIAVPKSAADISWLREGIAHTQIPYFVLGQGSNVLVSDAGFDGLIIRAHRLNLEIKSIETDIPAVLRVRTGASVAISSLLRRAAQEGWGGLQFLTGIPGSVGGAVTMNAGTHLGESAGSLRRVEAYTLVGGVGLGGEPGLDIGQGQNVTQKRDAIQGVDPLVFEGEDLQYQYRKNLYLPRGALIWAAEWEVHQQDAAQVKLLIDQTLSRRKATQPIDYPSCGSVFKNPSGHSAWQVIDRLGLRGHRIGNACFSEKHSNFIINLGSACALDVRSLIELAKARAKTELGITLEEEVIYLG